MSSLRNSIKYNDASGTIATGGTAQNLTVPASTELSTLEFWNVSDTVMTLNFEADATSNSAGGSFPVAAGAGHSWFAPCCPYGRLSVFCATTGKAFTCKWST